MKKIFKYLVAAMVVALFVGTFIYLYRKSKPGTVTYRDVEVVTGSISKGSVITGKIMPRNEVNVKPQINGIIAELLKKAGEHVKEGEVIARLKVIPDMNSLSSAQSRVRLSEINLRQARTNYEREKQLYDKKLVSEEEHDQAAQALAQAIEENEAAKDALEVIRDGVSSSNATGSSTLVRSTVTGLILDIPVKEGNSVIQANTMNDGTTVATVADMNDLIFDGQVDETEVGLLFEGMPMVITIGALPLYRSEAVLEYVSPKAVENNGANQFEIKAAVPMCDDAMIRSGYSANAEIVLQEVSDVNMIPESTIEFEDERCFVYLKGQDGSYVRTEIVTGLSDGIDIEVKSGLKAGDIIRGEKIVGNK